jgi:hypothetical protein
LLLAVVVVVIILVVVVLVDIGIIQISPFLLELKQ